MADPEAVLLTAAVAGDDEALSTLLERHGLAVRQGLSVAGKWNGILDADDVMQVTYLEAFLGIRKFKEGSPGSFERWLRRIAENNLLDAIRGLERHHITTNRVRRPNDSDSYADLLDELSGTATSPSQGAKRREIQQIVEDALKKLPNEYERVLRLHELEGKPGPEVAAILGRSHGAVRMLLCRAKDRLRDILASNERAFFSDTA